MPVVLRIGPYVFYFWSLEGNEPPHIHVKRDKNEVKFWLAPVRLASNKRYPLHELTRIRKLVEENEEFLLRSWYGYFPESDNRI